MSKRRTLALLLILVALSLTITGVASAQGPGAGWRSGAQHRAGASPAGFVVDGFESGDTSEFFRPIIWDGDFDHGSLSGASPSGFESGDTSAWQQGTKALIDHPEWCSPQEGDGVLLSFRTLAP